MGARKIKVYPYNGLDSDLKSLAKFAFIYESQIKYYSTEEEFRRHFPNAFYIYKHEMDKRIRPVKTKDIPNISPNDTITFYFTSGKYKVRELCRHLRNSFSHALLKKDGNKLVVTDMYRKRNTSIGYLQYTTIIDFLKKIIAEYEQ